jgi:hypothetical protein
MPDRKNNGTNWRGVPKIVGLFVVCLLCLPLGGCATLAGFTIGALVTAAGLGAVGGAAKFGTERALQHEYRNHIAYKRCRIYLNYPDRLERCVRKYV